jgi:hypothetical protein
MDMTPPPSPRALITGATAGIGADAATAERIAGDDRSTEQLASATFTELLRHGAAADSSQLLGSRAPVVRILINADTLNTAGTLPSQ